ncbi:MULTISPECIES: hypothetical protein [Methanosarcina]|uniref:S-layer family duplication domain-containing protein n=2 Tax=Methanosarcina barkeri TaxID=2208 RepID=A0A0E3LP91_METBA|nr:MULTISPECIES: hypothetical protein [Methanosarcina]AKB56111.1 hypothetical protein MSBRM_3113 [Methanosarcina barkeri MS]AKB59587.1 hypothetical protein MSBR2_3071 [Methanosarcina barkeri 227]OED12475.1 hypothetical protein A9239_00485 [Methanosarcina sp. A14]
MKRLSLFLILFTFILLILAPTLATALFTPEAAEIPYQINNSDRIVIGTVSEIDVADYYTNNTITVKEWLYNPLPTKTIIVRTNIGANASTEDEAEFAKNESVLLMLKDQRPDKGVFYMSLGFLGKHPATDRDAVIKELKAQGKWSENQIENKTDETEIIENIETVGEKKESSNQTQKSNPTPFMSHVSVIAVMIGAIIYIKRNQ